VFDIEISGITFDSSEYEKEKIRIPTVSPKRHKSFVSYPIN
jgi:hypothetical protein